MNVAFCIFLIITQNDLSTSLAEMLRAATVPHPWPQQQQIPLMHYRNRLKHVEIRNPNPHSLKFLKNQEFQRSIQVEYTRNHLFCSKATIARTKSFTLLLPSRCRKDLPRVEFGKNESEDSWNLEDAQLRHMPVAQHLPSFLLSSSEAKSFQATPI